MTPDDHRIIFKALGFLAVILSDAPQENQTLRAAAIAKLMEAFCATPLSPDMQTAMNGIDQALTQEPN